MDKEFIGKVDYIPEAGIDGKYYPYAVMDNYHQPIVNSSCYILNIFYKDDCL